MGNTFAQMLEQEMGQGKISEAMGILQLWLDAEPNDPYATYVFGFLEDQMAEGRLAVPYSRRRSGRDYVYRWWDVGPGGVLSLPMYWTRSQGRDGKPVPIPMYWTSREGRDGRVIAIPMYWTSAEGKDGRVVPVPLYWTSREGNDGRVVAVPPGWTGTV